MNPSTLEFPGGIYAITPETEDTGHLLTQIEAALRGGDRAGRTGEAGPYDDHIEVEFPRCVLHVPPDPWSACTMPGRRDVGMARR